MNQRTIDLLMEHREASRKMNELRKKMRHIEEELRNEQQQNYATALTPRSISGSWPGTSARPTTGSI
jgi:hypothetical protein